MDEPDEFEAEDVRIVTVGLTGELSVEVIARRTEPLPDGEEGDAVVHWFRFNLQKNNSIVRKFMQKAGIRDISRAEEGAYQYLAGFGPLKMKCLIVGIDSDDLGDGTQTHTFVLADVKLTEQHRLYGHDKPKLVTR